jgi:hypothetical protein
VGGDDTVVYAVGPRVIRSTDGAWEEVDALALQAFLTSVASTPHVILLGGDNVIYASHDSFSEPARYSSISSKILAGRAQPDGSAVFWTVSEVIEYRGHSTHLYRFLRFRSLEGVVVLGDYLYAGGVEQDRSLVIRTRRRQR